MENLLYLYADKLENLVDEAIVCFDERPVCLLEDYLPPIPPKPNHIKKVDYQYLIPISQKIVTIK
ncbi:MAG: hypothetical protein F6K22_37810 [Okeania sp. SIO2F4]|uniref:hypothetical protein n=1 Tax=Okeania sp. SIO2F4 TaxID=2607790 RepID=UPI00142A03FE|nr:hypothetical protein [Okeania sp. SIO2F4]NES08036.1 hypothetical protein [Okeania sp. SIO2F4]